MAVVDASVWIAYFHIQDKFHQKAVEIIKNIVQTGKRIVLPNLELIEVAGAIRRITKIESSAQSAIDMMRALGCEFLEIDSIKIEPIATNIAMKYSCRGADACYIAVAVLTKSKLWTFDNLQKESAAHIVEVATD